MAIRSITLSPAEALLYKITEEQVAAEIQAAKLKAAERFIAIYSSHGLPSTQEGYFQKDPLDPKVVRFLYDDGTEPPLPDPDVIQPHPVSDRSPQEK